MKSFLTAKWQNIIMANYEIDSKILLNENVYNSNRSLLELSWLKF